MDFQKPWLEDLQKTWVNAIRPALNHRRFQFTLIGVFLVILLWQPLSKKWVAESPSDWLRPEKHSFQTADTTLHLLIPATETNQNLCKTILSAAVNDYPAPILINWGNSYTDTSLNANGSHIGKLTGVWRWLNDLKPQQHDQLVLVIDGYDTWFQLPYSVLVSRYKRVNEYLTSLTRERIGQSTMNAEDISQSIIFPAERNCGPNQLQYDEVSCYAQPESPLPQGLYGPKTDTLDPDTHLPLNMRPHWLNSGLTFGPAREMLYLYDRANAKLATSDHRGSDQHIFNEIFGEQEYIRQVKRLHHLGFFGWMARWLGFGERSIIDDHPTHKPMKIEEKSNYEFGLGLDYRLELTHSAVFAEFDGNWLDFSNVPGLLKQQKDLGHAQPAIKALPDDISLAINPFHNLTGTIHASKRWNDVPLYTNLYTGAVPVMIHMNGFKTMREAIWDRMWFNGTSRALLAAYGKENKVGAWDDRGNWLAWDALCKDYEKEVFRDIL